MNTDLKSFDFSGVADIMEKTMPVYNSISEEGKKNIQELLDGFGFHIYDLAADGADIAKAREEIYDVIADNADKSWMTIVYHGTGIWACELLSVFRKIENLSDNGNTSTDTVEWVCGFCGKRVVRDTWNPLRQHMLRGECIVLCFN